MEFKKIFILHFTKNKITHNDLFFVDGSTPPDEIVS